MSHTEWSVSEIRILKEKYGLVSAKKLSEIISRTENSIRQMAFKLKINRINYKEWNETEEFLLKELYSGSKKSKILKTFTNRNWANIRAKAKKLGLKRQTRHMDQIMGNVSCLLNENDNISGYWLGFLLADGHFSKENRICLGLANLDLKHLEKFGRHINFLGKVNKQARSNTISIMDSYHVRLIKERYDIKNNKTYNPPDAKIFNSLSNDFFLSVLIGFIDGDGYIADRKLTNSKLIVIKCHSSWLNILNYFIFRLSSIVNIPLPAGKINNCGYARVIISNNRHIIYLKKKAIELNLPILERKWNKVIV